MPKCKFFEQGVLDNGAGVQQCPKNRTRDAFSNSKQTKGIREAGWITARQEGKHINGKGARVLNCSRLVRRTGEAL
jgi:hypothetical protein